MPRVHVSMQQFPTLTNAQKCFVQNITAPSLSSLSPPPEGAITFYRTKVYRRVHEWIPIAREYVCACVDYINSTSSSPPPPPFLTCIFCVREHARSNSRAMCGCFWFDVCREHQQHHTALLLPLVVVQRGRVLPMMMMMITNQLPPLIPVADSRFLFVLKQQHLRGWKKTERNQKEVTAGRLVSMVKGDEAYRRKLQFSYEVCVLVFSISTSFV